MVRFVLCCAAVVLLAVYVSAAPYNKSDKSRSRRGFKNSALSTARGFGKRAEVGDGGGGSDVMKYFDRQESYPSNWLVEEIQGNPELARIVVDKFVDLNQDGELTADELLGSLGY